MKKKILLLGVFSFLMLIQACVKITSSTDSLSDNDKIIVIKEIMDLTTNWANSGKSMDADKSIEFWDSSDSLMFAENGAFFPSRDSIHTYLKSFYSQTKNMNVEWGKRVIVPLSKNAATMSGYFHFRATFKTDEVYEGNSMFTGVFIKKKGTWVLLHGHESVEQKL